MGASARRGVTLNPAPTTWRASPALLSSRNCSLQAAGRAASALVPPAPPGCCLQVLILSERLRALTAAFDRLRSLRFQQLQQQEASRQRRLPGQGGAAAGGGGGAGPPSRLPQTTGQLHELLSSQQRHRQQQHAGPPRGLGGPGAGPPRQQQMLMDPENQALQLELISMGEQVGGD